MDNDEIVMMLEDCENREADMTEWECNFIQALIEQIAIKALTSKQVSTLNKIWERIT